MEVTRQPSKVSVIMDADRQYQSAATPTAIGDSVYKSTVTHAKEVHLSIPRNIHIRKSKAGAVDISKGIWGAIDGCIGGYLLGGILYFAYEAYFYGLSIGVIEKAAFVAGPVGFVAGLVLGGISAAWVASK